MRVLGRIVLVLAAALAVLVAILAYRTFTFSSPAAVDLATVRLASAPAVDEARAAAHLAQAVRIRTVTNQDAALNDIAQWDVLHSWLNQTYPATNAALTRETVAGKTLIYTWQGSDRTLNPIVLMAHQDVVPVAEGTESAWKHPPFDGVVAEGAVWGRGSVDDKGSLVSLMEATEALVTSGFKPRRSIILVFGHDEESGQTGSMAAAAALKARGVEAEFVLDEGLVTVADFSLLKGPAAFIGIAEKGYGTLRVEAKAAGGHSSMPPPRTAVQILAEAVLAIANNPDPASLAGPGAQTVRAVAPYASLLTRMAIANEWLFGRLLIAEMSKTPAGAAMLHTTTAPTMLSGSPKENVLPQTATAAINYRILPGQTPADVMARARKSVGDLPVDLSWIGEPKNPSPVSSTTSEAWKWIAALASENGSVPVAPSLVLGSTDSYHLAPIARDVYRYQPIVLTLAETAMIHGTDEHMTLDNLRRLIAFYARLMATAAG